MIETLIERKLLVQNALGLHARAAAQLVKIANRFQAEVTLVKDGQAVNGKSIMGVLSLAATQGSEVLVRADGADAGPALQEIAALFAARFGEAQ